MSLLHLHFLTQTLLPDSTRQWRRPPISDTSTGFGSRLGVASAKLMTITSLTVIPLAPLFLAPHALELRASNESLDPKFQTWERDHLHPAAWLMLSSPHHHPWMFYSQIYDFPRVFFLCLNTQGRPSFNFFQFISHSVHFLVFSICIVHVFCISTLNCVSIPSIRSI